MPPSGGGSTSPLGSGGGGGTPPPPSPAPSIFSIEPGKADNDKTVDITIRGANFSSDMTSKLTKLGEVDISGVNSSFINTGLMIFTFDIRDKTIGNWTVFVTNPGGTSSYNSFTINTPLLGDDKEQQQEKEPLGPAPIITSVSPIAGYNNLELNEERYNTELGFKINISGTNFDEWAVAYLIRGETDYVPPVNFEFVNSRLLFGYFDLTDVPSGYWDLVVFNSDGQRAQIANAFNVIDTPPLGIISRGRFFPQSGLKYTIDLLGKWLGGGEEENILIEEEYLEEKFAEEIITKEKIEEEIVSEENFEDMENFEEDIQTPTLETSFNKWQMILELTKERTNLFINKVFNLFSS